VLRPLPSQCQICVPSIPAASVRVHTWRPCWWYTKKCPALSFSLSSPLSPSLSLSLCLSLPPSLSRSRCLSLSLSLPLFLRSFSLALVAADMTRALAAVPKASPVDHGTLGLAPPQDPGQRSLR
jgi:hypothetical protein